jgi:hypothetical protein
MPVLTDWTLQLEVDQVLRGQGADPAIVRARRPALVAVAERALEIGMPLLQPVVAYERLEARGLRHERLSLDGGVLHGALIAEHLGRAEQIVLMVCTIGDALDAGIAQQMDTDPVFGLALDGLGSAAVESLAGLACSTIERETAERGWHASLPLSPGMIGWPVAEGQSQIFSLLDPGLAGVRLTESGMMIPRKSLSIVLGLGADVASGASACSACSLNATCRYQDHYPADPPPAPAARLP